MNGYVSVIGMGRKIPWYSRVIPQAIIAIAMGGVFYTSVIIIDQRTENKNLINRIHYILDANRDGVLDQQESSALTERGLFPKEISLGELEKRLRNIHSETLEKFLEALKPKR